MTNELLTSAGWGTPIAIGIFLACLGIFLLCLGGFIWMLAKAQVIKAKK